MDDKAIIELYWKRSEQAIAETQSKYGRLCYRVAFNVLSNQQDAEESVNDTYLATWNALPPHRPGALMAFLAKLTRRISITRWYSMTAQKRGGGQIPLALDELGDCEADGQAVEDITISKDAYAALNRFLGLLPETERKVFLQRYFLLDPIPQIALQFGFSESKVTSMLHRTRLKLRKQFIEEGYL